MILEKLVDVLNVVIYFGNMELHQNVIAVIVFKISNYSQSNFTYDFNTTIINYF
jgi:hypothetical protein